MGGKLQPEVLLLEAVEAPRRSKNEDDEGELEMQAALQPGEAASKRLIAEGDELGAERC